MFERLLHKEPPKPLKNADGLTEYAAFHAKDKLRYLKIYTATQGNHTPAYFHLLKTATDGERGKEISLLFSYWIVNIRGNNLQEVALSLEMRGCAFIQEFDPHKFAKPKPEEPIIDSIEFTARE
jgi:hypothetical protein